MIILYSTLGFITVVGILTVVVITAARTEHVLPNCLVALVGYRCIALDYLSIHHFGRTGSYFVLSSMGEAIKRE